MITAKSERIEKIFCQRLKIRIDEPCLHPGGEQHTEDDQNEEEKSPSQVDAQAE